LVTEHTIEEKIVERAQQKLKLDAMVVQSGRLKEKDSKLSRDELLAAVRFGADKIFKSKDSSITDDDIDMILDIGKRKTQELNEKLQTADKGDLLDFKLDGSSVKTFEGVDYSASALAQAKAEAEMLGILDMGKRERKEANYNENSLFQKQIASVSGQQKPKKKKIIRLPKELRLPRMEEWQMYDRDALLKIQEEEEAAFRELPDEVQKLATMKHQMDEQDVGIGNQGDKSEASVEEKTSVAQGPQPEAFVLPPLISDEKQELKTKLLKEGFSEWKRFDFNTFLKASSKYGRSDYEKIALEVSKLESDVRLFAAAFWGDRGRNRIAEHEYDKAVKMIERGEKRLVEIKSLERGTHILVSLFDNPWQELEFTYVNCKDKMFTAEEDRYLLCWTRKVRA
jgi:SWI/SNF-related matrix-associated actin-dependent regulator of chromatin subfamily A member 5